MRFRLTSLFLTAAIFNALAQQGECDSIFSASVGTDGGAIESDSGFHFASASHVFHLGDAGIGPGISGLVRASAGFGRVGAQAQVTAEGTPGRSTSLITFAHAEAIYEDVIISAPLVTATRVDTTVHFGVHGDLSAFGPAASEAGVIIDLGVEGLFVRGVADFANVPTDPAASGFYSSGFLGDHYHGGEIFVDVPGNVRVNVPTTLIKRISVSASAGQNGYRGSGVASSAEADYFSTVSFVTGRPVFDLPEGYTVNSVSANIVNNYWLGDPVPEPSSAVLILMAAAGWSATSIRRRRDAVPD